MITILENDLIITNFRQNEQSSNSQTLLFVCYSMTLIEILNKFKRSLSADFVSVQLCIAISVYF